MVSTNRLMAGGLLTAAAVAALSVSSLIAQPRGGDAGASDAGTAEDVRTARDAVRNAVRNAGGGAESANKNDLTLDQAHAAAHAAAEKAGQLDTKMNIAVVDAGGNLKAFARMDGAWLGSVDISIKKAKTARYFDMNTGELGKLSQPGQPLFGIEHSNDGLITFPGGVPIKGADGTIIGAIGVSGSSVGNDHEVAQAGADAALSGKGAHAGDSAATPTDTDGRGISGAQGDSTPADTGTDGTGFPAAEGDDAPASDAPRRPAPGRRPSRGAGAAQ